MNAKQRAAEFRQLLESPFLKEVFDEMERDTFEEIASLKLGEATEKEKDALIHKLQIIRNLWTTLSHNATDVTTKVQQVV